MDFVAIDVETANPDLASICQIGVVTFVNGQAADRWQSLVDPEDFFDERNTSIHGIDERAVRRAPKFPIVHDVVARLLRGKTVVSHMPFDRVALIRVLNKYRLEQPEYRWLDTARVARRAWPQFSQKGYGLENLANELGISFRHHEAQEDARAAGEILIRAMQTTGLSLADWFIRVNKPIALEQPGRIAQEGNPEGALFGEVVVFTGALSIPRKEAAELAAQSGCQVMTSVNKMTTLLVVGEQDIRRLAGHEKSSKHRRAEELMAQGQPIRVLRESDFQRLVELSS